MSSWNYRILTDGEHYWVGEVFYDRGNRPKSYSEGIDILRHWDQLEGLANTLRLASFALDRPPLTVKDGKIVGD